MIPPLDYLLNQAGIGISLHTHDGALDSATNRNQWKSMFFLRAGRIPTANHLLNPAGIGILLCTHDGARDSVTNRNQRKSMSFMCAGRAPTANNIVEPSRNRDPPTHARRGIQKMHNHPGSVRKCMYDILCSSQATSNSRCPLP